jgi:peptidoglycan/xylan/chitin deacetylase (PgdA/CDA1 family)
MSPRSAHNVPVLMYHHVSPTGGMIAVTPDTFDAQIRRLAESGYRSLTTAEFAAHQQGQPVPEKSVLITFDDGYLDNWVHAHPILARYGMKATIFLVTGWVNHGPRRPHVGQPGNVPVALDHEGCKQRIADGQTDDVILRWDEIRAMIDAGTFEFHSHTHTHTRWDRVCGENVEEKRRHMQEELAASRDALIRELGSVSGHLCWPQGYFDNDYLDVARAADFHYFYTTDALGQNTIGSDPEHIFRFAVRNRAGNWLNRRIWLSRHPFVGPNYHAWKGFKRRLRGRS